MTATNMCYNFVGFRYSPPLTETPNNSIIPRDAVSFSCVLGCGAYWKSVSLSLTGGRNSLSDVLPEVKALPWLPD